jgi:hypothetical protein
MAIPWPGGPFGLDRGWGGGWIEQQAFALPMFDASGRKTSLEANQHLLSLVDQLLMTSEIRFQSIIEFALIDLRQRLQQPLVAGDLLTGGLQFVEGGQMLVFLIWVVGHQHKAEGSRLTDLNRWPSLYKSAALPLS